MLKKTMLIVISSFLFTGCLGIPKSECSTNLTSVNVGLLSTSIDLSPLNLSADDLRNISLTLNIYTEDNYSAWGAGLFEFEYNKSSGLLDYVVSNQGIVESRTSCEDTEIHFFFDFKFIGTSQDIRMFNNTNTVVLVIEPEEETISYWLKKEYANTFLIGSIDDDIQEELSIHGLLFTIGYTRDYY